MSVERSRKKPALRAAPPLKRRSRWLFLLIVPIIVMVGLLANGSMRGKLNPLTKSATAAATRHALERR